MCAIIMRSPVIMRRPMTGESCSFGIDSQRCRVAFRSSAMVSPSSAARKLLEAMRNPISLPVDLEPQRCDPYVRRLLAGEDADRREATPEHAGEPAADEKAELAGGLRV